ncbi:MAG: filamentous hemagglutinin N-terminal domain-containing protein, partial [Phycisphaerales bacterium]|nr:filamentous hemagglutinin N-terminal domain-containing protein [Phycisphaerales bacterium]
MTRRPSTTPRRLRGALTLAAAIATAGLAVPVLAGGGVDVARVRRGDVKFERHGNQLTVTASNGAIIDYNRFSIAAGEVAQFVQPTANSRVLNRVTGREMSRIDGALLSNGIVYLVNPQGVRIGGGAFIDVGGFYAAAGAMSDRDFVQGIDRFTNLAGQVTNEGLIRAESVTLVGQYVANRGVIDAPDGVVAMAAGDSVYL